METSALEDLSRRTSALVAAAAAHVLRVDGRHRGPASGVVWSADGVAVAANHAIERDEQVDAFLPSGETAEAEVVGRDPTTDLAVLRVRAPALVPASFVETAGLAAGEIVLAVSRPGRSPRASLGLLARAAGEWRGAGGGRLDRFLETSLELYPGLSGGLAISAAGAAIGLVTSGLLRGAAMIVPTETLRRVVKALLAHGGVRRGYIGVAMVPVRLPTRLAEAAGRETALLVSAVEPDSPAERAGILLGDALLSIGGGPLGDAQDLLPLLEEERIGDALPVRIARGGELRELSVTVGARDRRRP